MRKATKLRIQVVLLYSAWFLACLLGVLTAAVACIWTFLADLLEEALSGLIHMANKLDRKYENAMSQLQQADSQGKQEDRQEDRQEDKQEEDKVTQDIQDNQDTQDTQASSEEKQKTRGE